MPRMSSRSYVWTLNMPKDAEAGWMEDAQKSIREAGVAAHEAKTLVYIGFQWERVENDHLQGVVQFAKRTGLRALKKLLGKTVHVEPMRGTIQQAVDYI
jgi:hypothetical protein